jgi:hypothetical protein
VPLPSVRDAEAWFVGAARAAVESGERLDEVAAQLLVAIAPFEPWLGRAIDEVEASFEHDGLAAIARDTVARFEHGKWKRDPQSARDAVTRLEDHMLASYRPGCGFASVEDDVAVARAMLVAYEFGRDQTHVMMAEELMLHVLRRYWQELASFPLHVACETAVVLDGLASATEKPEYHTRAVEALDAFADRYRDLGWRAAPFVLALKMIS